jgi:hypothetical protein
MEKNTSAMTQTGQDGTDENRATVSRSDNSFFRSPIS